MYWRSPISQEKIGVGVGVGWGKYPPAATLPPPGRFCVKMGSDVSPFDVSLMLVRVLLTYSVKLLPAPACQDLQLLWFETHALHKATPSVNVSVLNTFLSLP